MEISVSVPQVLRYLRYRGDTVDPETESAVREAIRRLRACAEPRHTERLFPLAMADAETAVIGGIELKSRSLSRNLSGCREAWLMAATLGLGPDRAIARAQAEGNMAGAMILQAAGAAMIEEVCDGVNARLRRETAERGLCLRPRFSPGYGDLSLSCQPALFRLLRVQQTLGITLTESLLMVPTKSVTALIGVSEEPCSVPEGCSACGRQDCPYRA
ncbi:MAG: Vitamin B12 dependent methionine synthase activation subunit [Clostridia bacterium]|nr:Vitamin B12 dependent methionine synthase activation subunit [Clostridia bacterium]